MNVLHHARIRQIRGVIFALLGGIGWGFSGACGQYLFMYYDVNPLWLADVRMVCAGVMLTCVCMSVPRWRSATLKLMSHKSDVVHLVVFALLGLTLCQVSYLLAIKYSNAATATVLQYIGPVFIVVYVCVSSLKAPRAREIIALICVIVGTFLIATHGNMSTMVLSSQGLFWGIAAAVSVALYTLLPRRLMATYASLPVTALAMLVGGVVLCVVCRPWTMNVSLDVSGMLAVAAIVVLGTAVGFTLYLQGVADIGASRASLISSIETVSATLFAMLWLGTPFMWIDFIGFACIMMTVVLLAQPHGSE